MCKRLLTIQDISCLGQCSLTVALPIISACGVETAVLPSAVLSTHTGGFQNYTFRDLTADLPAIEEHWIAEHLLFDAFYTGYVGAEQIPVIRHILTSCAAPGALRLVDPVMGDNGKLYAGFAADFPDRMRELCKNADCILPNLTEAALLLHRECVLSGYNRNYIETLVRDLAQLGPRQIVLTGVSFSPDQLGVATFDGNTIHYYFNPKQERMTHGTGDVYASVFAGALMRGWKLDAAAALAADFVCDAIRATPPEHWYGVCFEKALPKLIQRLQV